MCEKARNSGVTVLVLSITLPLSVVAPRIVRAEEPGIGPLFNIAATAGAEASLSAAYDGTNFLVGIDGDADAPYNIGAQRVGPDGSLIGDLISTGRTGQFPFVAFGAGNYLMVWTDDATYPNHDVYGQLISTSGALFGPPFPISADAGAQDVQSVAFNGSNFLVVWWDGTDDGLYGRLVSTSGSLVGSRLSLGDRSSANAAAVASNGQDFLVVWQRYASGGGGPYDLVGRIASGGGSLGAAFVISELSSGRPNPVSLAYNGSQYLVVWNHDTSGGAPDPAAWDILGRRIATDGSIVSGVLSLATGGGDQVVLPCGLASQRDGFLLTWFTGSLEDVAGADVCGQYLDSNGSPRGGVTAIAGGAGGQWGCGLSYGSDQYLCVIVDTAMANVIGRFITRVPLLHDWNGDGIISIVGDVPPFVNCVYFGNCPGGVDPVTVGDCNHDGIVSIVGDVPCFVDCVYFGDCSE
jgi:hypothetical protein